MALVDIHRRSEVVFRLSRLHPLFVMPLIPEFGHYRIGPRPFDGHEREWIRFGKDISFCGFDLVFVMVPGLCSRNEACPYACITDMFHHGRSIPSIEVSGHSDRLHVRSPQRKLDAPICDMRSESPVSMMKLAGVVKIQELVCKLFSCITHIFRPSVLYFDIVINRASLRIESRSVISR